MQQFGKDRALPGENVLLPEVGRQMDDKFECVRHSYADTCPYADSHTNSYAHTHPHAYQYPHTDSQADLLCAHAHEDPHAHTYPVYSYFLQQSLHH